MTDRMQPTHEISYTPGLADSIFNAVDQAQNVVHDI